MIRVVIEPWIQAEEIGLIRSIVLCTPYRPGVRAGPNHRVVMVVVPCRDQIFARRIYVASSIACDENHSVCAAGIRNFYHVTVGLYAYRSIAAYPCARYLVIGVRSSVP